MDANPHDSYAAEYDEQVQQVGCHIADVLFGLCYPYTIAGQRLLDAGIGTGLSAQPFWQAGLVISGMDFSPAMLEICRAKALCADLKQHDLRHVPWPFPAARFDHVVCCGVLHFLPGLEGVFAETRRVLAPGGVFAFTTLLPSAPQEEPFTRRLSGGFEIFSHTPAYVQALLEQNAFRPLKMQKCLVGEEVHAAWVAARQE